MKTPVTTSQVDTAKQKEEAIELPKVLRPPKKINILNNKISLILIAVIIFTAGIVVGKYKGIPFFVTEGEYAIGIFVGDSPFSLVPHPEASNPIISSGDITDISAKFVADPFMVQEEGVWYLFFEILNNETNQGDIGLSTSFDGVNWTYQQVVLDEPFHLSYPLVFKWQDEYYMVPESNEDYAVKLYKAQQFPFTWQFEKNLIRGNYRDPTIFRFNDHWWVFVTERYDVLHLYFSDELDGIWKRHPESPIVLMDANNSRSGGRVLAFNDTLIRVSQDCYPYYGMEVNAFLITELTTEKYHEVPYLGNPLLKGSGKGWNAERMHHMDAHQVKENLWIACVDGWRRKTRFDLRF